MFKIQNCKSLTTTTTKTTTTSKVPKIPTFRNPSPLFKNSSESRLMAPSILQRQGWWLHSILAATYLAHTTVLTPKPNVCLTNFFFLSHNDSLADTYNDTSHHKTQPSLKEAEIQQITGTARDITTNSENNLHDTANIGFGRFGTVGCFGFCLAVWCTLTHLTKSTQAHYTTPVS